MSAFNFLPLSKIHRRADARPLDESAVAALADSIAKIELRSPIHVRLRADNDYELIAGSHRLAAYEKLGLAEIEVLEVIDDDLTAELAMIDENLVRAELSPADRARQTARRKAIYEELHPETRREATLMQGAFSPSRQVGETGKAARFTADTATRTGQSERSVQRDAERGEKVCEEALALIRGTKLNTGSYLDKLKKLSADRQVAMIRSHLTGSQAGSPPAVDQPAVYARFVDLADRIEALVVADVIAGSGRNRAVLGQRASGVAEHMSRIMEGVGR